MRSKVSRNFVLLAPPSCGEISANKSANVGALIFIVTLFGSVLIMAYHPPFVQRFLNLLSNHNNYPESICYHEDPRITEGERYCSVYAMVMDVTAGKLWVTDGYPCEGKVSEYQL